METSEDVEVHNNRGNVKLGPLVESLEDQLSLGSLGSIPGQPEQDYPVFQEVPQTSFTCADKQFPGYFADTEARCQVRNETDCLTFKIFEFCVSFLKT